jgi:hypothetical protein
MRLRTRTTPASLVALALLVAPFATGCDTPSTWVVLDNHYPPSGVLPLVVYDAFWETAEFPPPIPPGTSSEPQPTVAASPNLAYVLLAPGWDGSSTTTPAAWVLLESRDGFEVHLNDTLHIPVDDDTFAGNCAAGSHLSQDEADFLTQRVFASEFGSLGYDPATCTTTGGG